MFSPQHRPDFIKPNLKEFNEILGRLALDKQKCLRWSGEASILPSWLGDEQYLEYAYTGTRLDRDLPPELTVGWDLFVDNWHELLGLLTFIKEEFNVSALLSLGPLGCITAVKDGRLLHAYVPEQVKPQTRVGAGDCLVAGFLSRYGGDPPSTVEDALVSGVAAATARIGVEESLNGKYLNLMEYSLYKSLVKLDTYEPGNCEPQFVNNVAWSRFYKGAVACDGLLPKA